MRLENNQGEGIFVKLGRLWSLIERECARLRWEARDRYTTTLQEDTQYGESRIHREQTMTSRLAGGRPLNKQSHGDDAPWNEFRTEVQTPSTGWAVTA